jgi:hypothetical protein
MLALLLFTVHSHSAARATYCYLHRTRPIGHFHTAVRTSPIRPYRLTNKSSTNRISSSVDTLP